MLGPVSKQRLTLVHPKLASLITTLDSQMSESLGVTQGLRNDDEQWALWAQGRLPVDQVNALRAKVSWSPIQPAANLETVTEARPGYSQHEFGLAVDVVPLESSGQADWNVKHPVWQELVTKGTALGFVSGISWKDEPHFQLTGRFPVTPNDEMRQLLKQGGLQAVWAASGIS